MAEHRGSAKPAHGGGRVIITRAALTLVLALGLAFVTFGAEAQQAGKVYRVGFLSGPPLVGRTTALFEQQLHDLGWHNGENILIEYRSAEGKLDRLPAFAAELLRLKVDLILAVAAPDTKAAREATRSIPIVFAAHGDPVAAGDVQSLSRPGGNITGLALMHPELVGKQLELLKTIAPRAVRVAVLWNAGNPIKVRDYQELKAAAKLLRVVLESHEVRRPADRDVAFSAITQKRPDALLVLGDPVTFQIRTSITDFATKARLPAMYPYREFIAAGGLMSYGADLDALFRRAAGYVDKILKGAKPADLPVEQPTKFDLVINRKTAKVLGLTIPPALLVQADQVIE